MGRRLHCTGAVSGWWAVATAIMLALPEATLARESDRLLQLATLDWPPYVGQQLDGLGPTHQIVAEALSLEQHSLQSEFLPWAKAIDRARSGEVVGMYPGYFDSGRDAEFVFSDPLPGGPIALYKRRDDPIRYATDPRSDPEGAFLALRQYRIGVVRGYINTRTFDAATYLRKEEAPSDATNLKKLAYGRVDLIVIDTLVAEYLLGNALKDYATRLELKAPPLEYKPLYVAFSRLRPETPKALAALNRGLATLRATGRVAEIMHSHGLHSDPSALVTASDEDARPDRIPDEMPESHGGE